MKPLFIRTSKTGSSFIANYFVDCTKNFEWLDSKENLEIINNHEDSLKFTVVRNPYDRAFSCWKYGTTTVSELMTTHIPGNYILPQNLSFVDFLTCDLYKEFSMNTHTITHIIPISDYVGEYIKKINYIIKIENAYDDLRNLSRLTGHPLDHFNTDIVYGTPYNKKEKYELLSNHNIIKLINARYENDFRLFNYKMR